MSGKRVYVTVATLGIETMMMAIDVAAGEIITVLGVPRPDDKRLVVLWGDQNLVMFQEDVSKA